MTIPEILFVAGIGFLTIGNSIRIWYLTRTINELDNALVKIFNIVEEENGEN